jgi:glycosyltransferase involved in cell wall biosynthesis
LILQQGLKHCSRRHKSDWTPSTLERPVKVKVLHFFKTYLPDNFAGVERVIWNIAEGMAPMGVQSNVLSLSRQAIDDPVPVGNHLAYHSKLQIYVASTGISSSVFSDFERLAKNADIVHYHFPWPMMDLVHLFRRPSCPTVVTYHSDVIRQKNLLRVYKPVMNTFLQSVNHIVATSPNYQRSSKTLQRFQEKTSVIPIGINAEPLQPTQTILRKWRDRVGEGYFLFLGAARYYKGLQFLVQAAKQSGLKVVIAGANADEVSQFARGGLHGIQAIGQVTDEDKEALLQLCRAFVFPSHLRSEAFGVALLEAARAGRPMISCEIGTGTSYVNLDGVTGIVVPPSDGDALASAMLQLHGDGGLAHSFGIAARARYETLFTSKVMAEKYLALYTKLIENDHSRSGEN